MYSPNKQTEKKNFLYQLPFAIIHEVPACFPQLKVASSNLPIESASIIKSWIRYWLFIYQRFIISIYTVIV